MYRDGDGVAKDGAKAVACFEKAAAHGDADAQRELGYMYRDGDGVAKNV